MTKRIGVWKNSSAVPAIAEVLWRWIASSSYESHSLPMHHAFVPKCEFY